MNSTALSDDDLIALAEEIFQEYDLSEEEDAKVPPA
jgi:hypothetical protein